MPFENNQAGKTGVEARLAVFIRFFHQLAAQEIEARDNQGGILRTVALFLHHSLIAAMSFPREFDECPPPSQPHWSFLPATHHIFSRMPLHLEHIRPVVVHLSFPAAEDHLFVV
jgi:hypothetical protein